MLWIVVGGFAIIIFAALVLRACAKAKKTEWKLDPAPGDGADTLVVMVHGLSGGRKGFAGAETLVATMLPGADRLVVEYGEHLLTNADAYKVADVLEQAVHEKFLLKDYRSIVLFGHSAGAAVLRKAFVWAHGSEEDRKPLGLRGKREWVDRVTRIVFLSGMNRGWSVSPKPHEMSWCKYMSIRLGEMAGQLLGVGQFVMSMRRGAPFIADTRVQWIRVARSEGVVTGRKPFPQVIQLIGSLDDVVSREDGLDLLAVRGTLFKTLPQTDHGDIADVLSGSATTDLSGRASKIGLALIGNIEELEPDLDDLPPENRDVDRIVYVLHGIRDYGNWTDVLRSRIDSRSRTSSERTIVINPKYGYFSMAAFLMPGDRQRNVRRFVDQYTEDFARYPNVRTVDFVGHSNGTYILASALQRYATIRVRRVFFAGSVVPKDYPWKPLIDSGRVQRVVNIVASGDWVVAIFPKLFEQIADYFNMAPTRRRLDLGAAGFRGFLESNGSAAVNDFKFALGAHSTGVEISKRDKLDGIINYLVEGDEISLFAFRNVERQPRWLDLLSNITPLVWLVLIAILISIGWGVFAAWGTYALLAYIFVLALLLNSI